MPKEISWEEFNQKGYHIINVKPDYKSTPGLRWFYEGRECDTPDPGNAKRLTEKGKELGTFSGKIEFASESLKQYFPDDEERPVVPRYIQSFEGYKTPGCTTSIRCSSSRRIRGSRSTATTTSTPTG